MMLYLYIYITTYSYVIDYKIVTITLHIIVKCLCLHGIFYIKNMGFTFEFNRSHVRIEEGKAKKIFKLGFSVSNICITCDVYNIHEVWKMEK
jgi:hypothetical protein